MSQEELEALKGSFARLRAKLDPAFCAETAVGNSWLKQPDGTVLGPPKARSAGHCAVVAAIVHEELGGKLVSHKVEGSSHWFNRFKLNDGRTIDADLTGDQFGRSPIQIAVIESIDRVEGTLYGEQPKERAWSELNAETLARKELLRSKAGLEPGRGAS